MAVRANHPVRKMYRALLGALDAAGCTRKAVTRMPAGKRPWPRPAFSSANYVHGFHIRQALRVKLVGIDLHDFAHIYEAFLHTYLIKGGKGAPPPPTWAQTYLHLTRQDAVMLFGRAPGDRRKFTRQDYQLAALSFVALAEWNFEASVDEALRTYTAQVEGYFFGIHNGRMLTSNKALAEALPPVCARVGGGVLTTATRLGVSRNPKMPVLNRMRHWADKNKQSLGKEYPGVVEALTVMHWRGRNLNPSVHDIWRPQ